MLHSVLNDLNPWWRDPTSRRARDKPWRRDYQQRLFASMLRADDRRAIVLCGPRQVGKTVGLLQLADDLLERERLEASRLLYFDFSDDRLTAPVAPRDVLAAAPQADGLRFVLLDELTSCAPPWDAWLKQAVDAGGTRIVATDSSASLLRTGGRESGLGRWDEVEVETLTFREWCGLLAPTLPARQALQNDPTLLESYLRVGGYPEHARLAREPELVRRRLRSDLMDKAVRRDLFRLDLSRDLARLFAYLVETSGAEFKATERARDLDLDRRTVDKGVGAFLDAGLLRSVERWTTKSAARLRSPIKVHAADHGVVVAFAPVPAPWHDAPTLARTFEAVVFRHLRDVVRDPGAIRYYRDDRGGLEVDFLVEAGGNRIVVEVTSSLDPDRDKIRSTTEVARRVDATHTIIVHGGVGTGRQREVGLVPLHEFLLDPLAAIGAPP